MALVGDIERRALRLVVTGSADAGKTALVHRLTHDLRRPVADPVAFHSGGELARAVLSPEEASGGSEVAHHFAVLPGFELVAADVPPPALWDPEALGFACLADAAIVVVDALKGLDDDASAALEGVLALRLRHTVVAVNKMDLAGYEYEVFKAVRKQLATWSGELDAGGAAVIPVSAWRGDNVVVPGNTIDWYSGGTLSDLLGAAALRALALRHAGR